MLSTLSHPARALATLPPLAHPTTTVQGGCGTPLTGYKMSADAHGACAGAPSYVPKSAFAVPGGGGVKRGGSQLMREAKRFKCVVPQTQGAVLNEMFADEDESNVIMWRAGVPPTCIQEEKDHARFAALDRRADRRFKALKAAALAEAEAEAEAMARIHEMEYAEGMTHLHGKKLEEFEEFDESDEELVELVALEAPDEELSRYTAESPSYDPTVRPSVPLQVPDVDGAASVIQTAVRGWLRRAMVRGSYDAPVRPRVQVPDVDGAATVIQAMARGWLHRRALDATAIPSALCNLESTADKTASRITLWVENDAYRAKMASTGKFQPCGSRLVETGDWKTFVYVTDVEAARAALAEEGLRLHALTGGEFRVIGGTHTLLLAGIDYARIESAFGDPAWMCSSSQDTDKKTFVTVNRFTVAVANLANEGLCVEKTGDAYIIKEALPSSEDSSEDSCDSCDSSDEDSYGALFSEDEEDEEDEEEEEAWDPARAYDETLWVNSAVYRCEACQHGSRCCRDCIRRRLGKLYNEK